MQICLLPLRRVGQRLAEFGFPNLMCHLSIGVVHSNDKTFDCSCRLAFNQIVVLCSVASFFSPADVQNPPLQ